MEEELEVQDEKEEFEADVYVPNLDCRWFIIFSFIPILISMLISYI